MIKDFILCNLLKNIWKYSEPLDSESAILLYQELEGIEKWLKESV